MPVRQRKEVQEVLRSAQATLNDEPPLENPMIFRLSATLAKKLKEGPLPSMPLDENPYADWSAHLFTADRTQYIIVSNTKSLYSVVLYGKGITDDSEFIDQTLSTLREFMDDDGQAFVYRRFIAPACGTVQFAKALDRSVTGSINELVKVAKFALEDGERAPHDLGFELNDFLLSALALDKKASYGKPNEAFRALADGLNVANGEG